MTNSVLITCEHAGNRVPPPYRRFFAGHEALLDSHRGYDAGALALARDMARAVDAPLFVSLTSRLLVDLNRSPGHPRLYSEATRPVPAEVRGQILRRYYLPHRLRVERHVAGRIAAGARLIHIASHSFTPVLAGEVRRADVGLLYDPARPGEAALCRRWLAALRALAPALKVRRNYPYTGRSDGLAAYLRRRFPAGQYLGIELEINQRHVFHGPSHWRAMRGVVVEALRQALAAEGVADAALEEPGPPVPRSGVIG
jgi:predicted N-formylglutamate amidohydrolase